MDLALGLAGVISERETHEFSNGLIAVYDPADPMTRVELDCSQQLAQNELHIDCSSAHLKQLYERTLLPLPLVLCLDSLSEPSVLFLLQPPRCHPRANPRVLV